MAKIDVAPGLVYVVNFIQRSDGSYDCFFYPSVSSQNMMATADPFASIDSVSMQERIYGTVKNILQDFVSKYNPSKIVFTTQFQFQLSKVTSATIPGYSTEYTSGKQLSLVKPKETEHVNDSRAKKGIRKIHN